MLLALVLAACGGAPQTATPALSPMPTVRTPLPTPSTRTAPTLPPEFTSTPTPTITPTPTPSATFTVTATPDAATICDTVSWFGPLLDGRTLADDAAFLLDITLGWRDALAVLSWRDMETDEGEQVGVEGGTSALLNIEEIFGPGTYEMRLEVFTAAYSNICAQQITFTILPATPDTASTSMPSVESLLIEILTLIRDRLRGGE